MTRFACVRGHEFESDASSACPTCGCNMLISTDIIRPQTSQPQGGTPDVNGYVNEVEGWATPDGRWFSTFGEALAAVSAGDSNG